MGDKWVSLSGSDTACGLGERHESGCYGDAFDLFIHYEHDGNRNAAIRIIRAQQQQERAIFDRPADCRSTSHINADKDRAGSQIEGEEPGPPRPEPQRLNLQYGIRLSDFRAFMPAHNYIFTPSGEQWPAASVNSRFPPILVLDKNGNPVLNKKGDPVEQSPAAWLDEHSPVEQMTWAPGQPPIVADRLISDGGWIALSGCNVFNLYRPPVSVDGETARPCLMSRCLVS